MPEEYGYWWDPASGIIPDENIYYDPSLTEPAVVTAALPAKFNGSREAARRYAEGYRWGQENVVAPRERTAPYVAAGIGATMLAPYAISAAATGVTNPGVWQFGKRMLLDLPAFEVVDKLPTLIGQDRATVQAGNLLEKGFRAITPDGRFENAAAPYVNQAGQVIAGLPVGGFGELFTRRAASGIAGVLDRAAQRSVANRLGYFEPMSDVLGAEHLQSFELPEVSVAPIVEQKAVQAAIPYAIDDLGGGYMLKSLMRGNPLEKQMGKNGTVNVNNVRALVGKGSKVEQAVVDKVLASEEFAGKKSIDYNKFRKAVQDELITYERTPDTRWEGYGMNRIGVSHFDSELESDYEYYKLLDKFIKEKGYTPVYNQAGLDSVVYETPDGKYIGEKELEDIFRNSFNAKASTFTFSSPRIPNGSGKHYDPNTLGHSRTYTTADEPDVLHVMESQSDWAQQGVGEIKPERLKIAEDIQNIEASLQKGEDAFTGDKLDEYAKEVYRKVLEEKKNQLGEGTIEQLRSNYQQQIYNSEKFTSRQIQENLRYAAEKGQKKMRYPTRETAAKIEGYPERVKYYDKNGFEVKEIYEYPEDVAKRIESIQNEIDRIDVDDLDTFAPFDIREGAFAWGINSGEVTNAKYLAKLRDKILRDRDSLYQMRQFGDDNDMVAERLYNNEKLFENQVARYKKQYGHEPELDVYSSKSRDAKARRAILEPELKELLGNGPTQLKKGLIEKKEFSHEDILRKYTEFPKQYQKLFKGAEVRTVTDPKGNTWYEVDVPENYLQQEWAYAYGGLISRLQKHYGSNEKVLEAVRKFKNGGDKATLNHPKYNAAKEKPMYDYLRYRGLGAPQASGMLGNLAVESWLNADLQQQGGGPAYGLMQAEASRQTAMKNYDDTIYQFGSNLSPEEQQQLDYIIDKGVEVYTPGEWGRKNFKGARDARKAFINADDVRTASDIVTNNFLRPGKPHLDRRRAMSEYYYDKYNPETPYGEGFLWGNAPAFDFSAGGNLFWPGGTMNLTPYIPKVIAKGYGALKGVLSGDPEKQKKVAEKYHDISEKLPDDVNIAAYRAAKEAATQGTGISGMLKGFLANLIEVQSAERGKEPYTDEAFLLSPKRQREFLESLGYTLDMTNDYGLVSSAVNRYKDATGRDVPIYMYGDNDISREELIPLRHPILQNRTTFGNIVVDQEHFEEKDDIGDRTDFPMRLYRDANGNLYVKEWDFLDHGNYSHNKLGDDADLYRTKSLTDSIRQYGDLMDIAGNPFVRTTGYQKVTDFSLPYAYHILDSEVPDDRYAGYNYDLIKERILNGEFDIKANGGKIHIKPENRGKFTALKKRTGKSASWFKAHGTPAQKKMAVFALNAKKWKHADGGLIDRYGSDRVREALRKVKGL